MKKVVGAFAAMMFVAGCGGSESVSPLTLTEGLVEEGMDRASASCISRKLAAELSESEFSVVALAESAADIPVEILPVVEAVTGECL